MIDRLELHSSKIEAFELFIPMEINLIQSSWL